MSEKEKQSLKTVKNYMWWSMGAGLIPIPILDLAAIGSVQLKMLSDVSKVYGVPFEENRGKALISTLVGFILERSVAFGSVGSLLKAIPGLGALAGAPTMALSCGAYTWALGKVFVQHFEAGGTFLTFDPDRVKEYFKQQFEEGRRMATGMEGSSPADARA
jgi:uncharacterized protein (DUF697 family)